MQPAVGIDRGRGCLRELEVAGHHLVAADKNLPCHVQWLCAAVGGIGHPDIDLRQRTAHRVGPDLGWVTWADDVRQPAGLGLTVTGVELRAEAGLNAANQTARPGGR